MNAEAARRTPSAFLLAAALVLAVFTALAAPKMVGAASCESRDAAGRVPFYTVQICITSPTAGSTLAGGRTVSATVTVSSGGPGVQRVSFFLDGQPVLTDFHAPFTFTLPTQKFVDGTKTLEAEALLRDGFKSNRASISLTFNNGNTSPPVNTNTFTPSEGTTPSAGQAFKVLAAGDGASGEAGAQAVTDLISGSNPNLFLYLGDVYEKGTPTEFHNWYGTPSTFYGRFRSITNPTIGNHEYENNRAPGYFDYWDNVPNYYSFDTGGWHFISLNSNTAFDQVAPGTQQYQWLENDLQSRSTTCTLAYMHHPVFSIGPQGDTTRLNAMWSLLASYGVDIVVTAHDHNYQRWVPLNGSGSPSALGPTQFVVGTGGHGTQGFVRSDSRVAASLSSDFGALELRLGSAGATYQFVNPSGTALDSGSLQCSGSGSDSEPPAAPTNLSATSPGSRVDLSWTTSSDNVGVTGYKIYRNGTLLADVPAAPTTYVDGTVAPNATYTYEIRARDAAGNLSAPSNSAVATIAPQTILFSDGFESGSFSQWTSNAGMIVQQQETFSGAYAARATSTGAATWAYQQLANAETNVHYRVRFKIVSLGSTTNFMKFRTATGSSILGVYLSSTGKLSYRNDVAGVSTMSTTTVTQGVWHVVQVHVLANGAASQTETFLDGVKIDALSKTENFGTATVGRLQIGENSTGRTYDIIFDGLSVATSFVSDSTPPSTPALTLTESSAFEHVDGSNVYYNPAGSGGSLKVDASASDAESGVPSVAFPATFGADASVDRVEPFSKTYSWSPGATATGSRTVWATNGTGLSSGSAFGVIPDSSVPTGGSIGYIDGYVSTNAVLLSLADGTDTGSGIHENGESLERAEAPLADGACGTFGGYGAIIDVPAFDFLDLSVASGRCYKYRLVVPDRVANRAVFTSGSIVKVDADAPSVSLANPGSTVSGIVALSASATDAGGSGLQSVRFERSAAGADAWTLVGTSTSAPYSASWDTRSLPDGNYDVRAVARDGAGGEASSGVVTVAVQNDANGPTVALTAPAQGATVSGATTISATATDDVAVSHVEFLVNGNVVATDTSSPYSVSWDSTTVADGTVTVSARATDTSNNTTVSAAHSITVNNAAPPQDTTPPAVALTAPDDGSTVSGTVTISANATDNVAVQQVDFLVDGNVVATDTTSPYSTSWDTTTTSNGTAQLSARATDTSANVAASATRTVTVDNSGPPPVDSTPPSVSLTEPADGATVSGTVTIRAAASDNVGVVEVEFLVAGNVVGRDTVFPYSFAWDSRTVANGPVELRARATDLAANTATSATRTVTVDNGVPPPTDTTPPTVALTAPADGSTVSGTTTISADASDNVAIDKVEFLVNGNVVDTDSSFPYSISWDSRTVANGNATLTARATDTSNNATTSAARSVTVSNNATPPGDTTAPTVSLADPGNFMRGTRTLSATASDSGGVAQVVFQISPAGQNAWSTIASDTTEPYATDFATTSVADGGYDFRAVATDNAGNSANSVVAARTIDNTGASGSITAPTSGAIVSGAAVVTATATDNGSGVSQITFERSPAGQNSWTAIGAADTTEPYAASWSTSSLTDGSYDLRGVIVDDAGNESTTPVVTVVVRNRHTFTPVADAYVNAEKPTTNYGALTNLRVDASPIYRSYVRFNVDVSASIVRATLRVFTLSSSTTGYEVRGVTDNTWAERTITFNNAPAVSSTVTAASGSFSGNAWTELDVTSLVTSGGLVTFGWTTSSSTSKSFASRESGASAPQLIVETG